MPMDCFAVAAPGLERLTTAELAALGIRAAAVTHRVGAEIAEESDEEAEASAAQLFVVRLAHDVCTVSADTSGPLLHLRGYRQALAKAPLRETLAAAVLLGSGWDGRAPLT